MADDQILIDHARLIADQYDALGKRDAKACYAYAVGGDGSAKALDYLDTDLKGRELRLSERILASAPTHRNAPKARELDTLYTRIFQTLVARYGDTDTRLLVEPTKVKPADYASYCTVAAGMFREIARLPEAGSLLSVMFKDVASNAK